MPISDEVRVNVVTDVRNALKGMTDLKSTLDLAIRAVQSAKRVVDDLTGAYFVQEQAEAKLAAALKATGNAVGISASEMADMASQMQRTTVYGDEMVLNAQAIMVTFRNIGRDVFPGAMNAAADMSAVLGVDLQSAVLQLGKALNDPVLGITALNRAGITFSQEQRDTIKTMVEMNDAAGAQALILEEVNNQMGGVAKAMGDTGFGAVEKLKNAVGDLKEVGGGLIINFLKPAIGFLSDLATEAKVAYDRMVSLKDAMAADTQMQAASVVIEERRNAIARELARLYKEADYWAGMGRRGAEMTKTLQDQIGPLEEQYRLLVKQLETTRVLERERKAAATEADAAEAARAAAAAAQEQALADLNEAWAKTPEGQRAAIEGSIAYFETFTQGPKALAVLASLREELAKLTETATEGEKKMGAAMGELRAEAQSFATQRYMFFEPEPIKQATAAMGELRAEAQSTADYLSQFSVVGGWLVERVQAWSSHQGEIRADTHDTLIDLAAIASRHNEIRADAESEASAANITAERISWVEGTYEHIGPLAKDHLTALDSASEAADSWARGMRRVTDNLSTSLELMNRFRQISEGVRAETEKTADATDDWRTGLSAAGSILEGDILAAMTTIAASLGPTGQIIAAALTLGEALVEAIIGPIISAEARLQEGIIGVFRDAITAGDWESVTDALKDEIQKVLVQAALFAAGMQAQVAKFRAAVMQYMAFPTENNLSYLQSVYDAMMGEGMRAQGMYDYLSGQFTLPGETRDYYNEAGQLVYSGPGTPATYTTVNVNIAGSVISDDDLRSVVLAARGRADDGY